jgi:hypothetical protein
VGKPKTTNRVGANFKNTFFMKNVKMVLSAALILSVVGSALAFRTKIQPDIFRCVNFKCVKYENNLPYSSLAGSPVARPQSPFKGIENDECNVSAESPCKPYAGTVFLNQ